MSGVRMTMGQAMQVKNLRSCNGFPDIVIYERNERFNALFLEVKKESPYLKNEFRTLKKDKHLEEQENIHKKLILEGYFACFVWNFEMAKDIIDRYYNNKIR
jgi:G:T-mismatch repair DNA endonuclease (very short patch repair protein)